MGKPNPILAAYERKLNAEYHQRLKSFSEITMIAALMAAHKQLGVGPGRAPAFLKAFIEAKTQIAQHLVDDVGTKGNGDPHFVYTKAKLAQALRGILGEHYNEYAELFPMLEGF